MLMPLHDSMESFMNFRRVFDLIEFKNLASQCFAGNQRGPGVWNSFPFLAWDLSMHPRTHIWFFNQFICTGACALVQIWIMHMNALKTQLMHKNVETNPEKSQQITQHSCFSMLTREKNLKAVRGNGYLRPQRWDVPYRKPSCLLWEAPVCEKHIPKPAPNRTKFIPLHVDAAPW